MCTSFCNVLLPRYDPQDGRTRKEKTCFETLLQAKNTAIPSDGVKIIKMIRNVIKKWLPKPTITPPQMMLYVLYRIKLVCEPLMMFASMKTIGLSAEKTTPIKNWQLDIHTISLTSNSIRRNSGSISRPYPLLALLALLALAYVAASGQTYVKLKIRQGSHPTKCALLISYACRPDPYFSRDAVQGQYSIIRQVRRVGPGRKGEVCAAHLHFHI